MMRKKEILRGCLIAAMLFALAYVFYSRIKPLVILNMDDWGNLVRRRNILPKWGAWNPTRVLPEVFMPLAAKFASIVIYPLNGELIPSLEMGLALEVSFFVTVYAGCFYHMLRKRWKTSELLGYSLTVLFLLLHFVAFRSDPANNDYMLCGYYDAATYFFYLVPALWNASLVMLMIAERYFSQRREKSIIFRLLMLIGFYFGLMSNLYQSMILMAYTAADFCWRLVRQIKQKKLQPGVFLPHALLLIGWLVVHLFEKSGGRANDVGGGSLTRLETMFNSFFARITSLNWLFLVLLGLSVAGIAVFAFRRFKNPEQKKLLLAAGLYLTAGIFTLAYEMLLCAVTLPFYIQRGDVLICVFFYMFLFMMQAILLLIQKHKKCWLLAPALAVLCITQVTGSGNVYKYSINNGLTPDTARAITRDIVDQVIAMDGQKEKGQVEVPKFSSSDNWPIAYYGASFVSSAIYTRHGTENYVPFEFVATEEKSTEFGL